MYRGIVGVAVCVAAFVAANVVEAAAIGLAEALGLADPLPWLLGTGGALLGFVGVLVAYYLLAVRGRLARRRGDAREGRRHDARASRRDDARASGDEPEGAGTDVDVVTFVVGLLAMGVAGATAAELVAWLGFPAPLVSVVGIATAAFAGVLVLYAYYVLFMGEDDRRAGSSAAVEHAQEVVGAHRSRRK